MTRKQLIASRYLWRRRLKYRTTKLEEARKAKDERGIQKWTGLKSHARAIVERREKQLASQPASMRRKALDEAEKLIGVMEQGGNNRGAKVTEIIRANGGVGPEPWCGDFVAYVYRLAGSKAVVRAWASVYFLGRIGGLKKVETPKPGDLVRFNFSHVGLYVRDLGNGMIETIEGNTGASGATSDSSTGGDGVYRKHRPKSLILDYRRVLR